MFDYTSIVIVEWTFAYGLIKLEIMNNQGCMCNTEVSRIIQTIFEKVYFLWCTIRLSLKIHLIQSTACWLETTFWLQVVKDGETYTAHRSSKIIIVEVGGLQCIHKYGWCPGHAMLIFKRFLKNYAIVCLFICFQTRKPRAYTMHGDQWHNNSSVVNQYKWTHNVCSIQC